MMETKGQFSAVDYLFFVVVFVVSAAIGLYYAIKTRRKETTIDEYLLGGRNMSLLPVCCSLIATTISGAILIGVSAESYTYGSHTWLFGISMSIATLAVQFIFLPVFRELQLTSTFKYFELRFNRRVRVVASTMYILCALLYLPLTVYVPALTFQRVTGVDTHVTVVVLSLLCASYTAVGGFKAVVWTDVVQLMLMLISSCVVTWIGVQSAGGMDKVIEAAKRGGRILIINIDNWNVRTSLLQYFTNNILVFIYQFGLNQAIMQRYLSLPNFRKMNIAAWILAGMFTVFMLIATFLGLVMYANYETCDPTKAGLIKKVDQIVPHFIQEKASLFLGFNGIFVAGIFSASLSTTSSYLNAVSGIIYEDFISKKYSDLTDRSANRIMMIIVMVLGVVQTGMVVLIEKMGMLHQITAQIMALITGALLTLFILGVMVPKANSKGAIAGAIAAVAIIIAFTFGSLGKKPDPPLPFRTDGCESARNTSLVYEFSSTTIPVTSSLPHADDNDIFWLFRLSYVYYAFVGTIVGIVVGYLTSNLTKEEPLKNQKLLATFVRQKDIVEKEEEVKMQLM